MSSTMRISGTQPTPDSSTLEKYEGKVEPKKTEEAKLTPEQYKSYYEAAQDKYYDQFTSKTTAASDSYQKDQAAEKKAKADIKKSKKTESKLLSQLEQIKKQLQNPELSQQDRMNLLSQCQQLTASIQKSVKNRHALQDKLANKEMSAIEKKISESKNEALTSCSDDEKRALIAAYNSGDMEAKGLIDHLLNPSKRGKFYKDNKDILDDDSLTAAEMYVDIKALKEVGPKPKEEAKTEDTTETKETDKVKDDSETKFSNLDDWIKNSNHKLLKNLNENQKKNLILIAKEDKEVADILETVWKNKTDSSVYKNNSDVFKNLDKYNDIYKVIQKITGKSEQGYWVLYGKNDLLEIEPISGGRKAVYDKATKDSDYAKALEFIYDYVVKNDIDRELSLHFKDILKKLDNNEYYSINGLIYDIQQKGFPGAIL